MYIKNGMVALTTDNAKNTYFDGFVVTPLDCYKNPYDTETGHRFDVKTNRFRDSYLVSIDIVWY